MVQIIQKIQGIVGGDISTLKTSFYRVVEAAEFRGEHSIASGPHLSYQPLESFGLSA